MADVQSAHLRGFRRRNIGLFEAIFKDASKDRLLAKWFHGGYLVDRFLPGVRVALYGKVELDNYTGDLLMMHPEFEILVGDDSDGDAALHTGPHRSGLRSSRQSDHARVPVADASRAGIDQTTRNDDLPAALRERLKLPDRWTAIRALHFPAPGTDLRLLNAYRTPAQWRLIFEEFFWLECGLSLKRAKARLQPGISFELNERVREKIKAMLPFKPTGAQKRVLKEIAEDMKAPHPMSRLLQGDVGSGKTLVAAEAAVIAIENGYQAAVLAPTEILASQHYFYFKNLFQKMGYVPVLLTGSNHAAGKIATEETAGGGARPYRHRNARADRRRRGMEEPRPRDRRRAASLRRDAAAAPGVESQASRCSRDDRHSYPAHARAHHLRRSRHFDHRRTAARPQADRDQERHRRSRRKRVQLHEATDRAGRQAYVVYPVIEESEAMKAAQQMHQHLSREGVSRIFAWGCCTAKLKTDEKETVMDQFRRGEVKILVATTVIEVGVDVPNATVMVIEQAERFGLAQLHQLRGRVGRGAEQSYCILVTGKLGDAARERIRTMVDSSDGFYIAEMDLKLRGPGRVFWNQAIRPAGPADRQHHSRPGHTGAGAQRSPGIHHQSAVAGGIAERGYLSYGTLAAALRSGAGGLSVRVIGGEFRSRRLKSLPGLETRPTPDRLRETLFNVLAPRIADCVFMDIYAGTGAVGIEALSRGARRASSSRRTARRWK